MKEQVIRLTEEKFNKLVEDKARKMIKEDVNMQAMYEFEYTMKQVLRGLEEETGKLRKYYLAINEEVVALNQLRDNFKQIYSGFYQIANILKSGQQQQVQPQQVQQKQ